MNRAYELLGRLVVRVAWREYGFRVKVGAIVAAIAFGAAIYFLRRPPRPLPGPRPDGAGVPGTPDGPTIPTGT